MSLSQYSTYQKLLQKAKEPVDLTKEEIYTPKRVEEMSSALSDLFNLSYASERVDDETINLLMQTAKESNALTKMQAMQSGEVINRIDNCESENRKVLHTAMRAHNHLETQHGAALDAAKLAKIEIDKLREFCHEIDAKSAIDTIIQVGIGGSDLGPKAIYLSLSGIKPSTKNVHFVSNVDPDDVASVLKIRGLDLEKTLVVVVSKSGSTLETRTNEEFFRSRYLEKKLDPSKHIIAITGQGSPMDNPSNYLKSFYIWDFIGGRYSATSMVGLVTLGLSLGMDVVDEFLEGAFTMDQNALATKDNLPLLGAMLGIWNRNFLQHPTRAIIPYSQAMHRFAAHLQQLDMESNGKHIFQNGMRVDHETGPIIWGEPGTNGQHSFFQLIHQGTTVVPVTFIGFTDCQRGVDIQVEGTSSQEKLLSNLFAQSIALATGQQNSNPNKQFDGNRPNHILLLKKCTPFSMGLLLSYFENLVAFQGFVWGINSFDQEGVQLGKVLANEMIKVFSERRKGSTQSTTFPLGQAFLKHLM